MEDRDDYPIIPQPLNKNKEFLNWIYERMICVHGEKDLYDYMINFKSIIDSQVDIQNELTSLREQNEILRQSYKYIHESRSKAAAELNEVEKDLASLKEDFIRIREHRDEYWEKYKELQKAVGDALITDGGLIHPSVYNHLLELIQKT